MAAFLYTIDSDANTGQYTDDVRVVNSPPIDLQGLQYECALKQFDTFYGVYNVSAAFGNQVFKYRNPLDTGWSTYTIPEGIYTLESLFSAMQAGMVANHDTTTDANGNIVYDITFYADLSSGRVSITLAAGWQIDFTASNLNILMGFNSQIYNNTLGTAQTFESENVSNISNSINQIYVRFSPIAGNSWTNGSPSDVLYSFTAAWAPFQAITITANEVYVPLSTRGTLTNVRLYLTDQLDRRLNINGSHLSAAIYFRPSSIPRL